HQPGIPGGLMPHLRDKHGLIEWCCDAALINAALSHLSPPVSVKVSPAIGALAASTVSVTVLLRVLKRSKVGDLPGLKGEE
ncbi:hypothetical protein ACUODJ_46630, partial [Escherichia sp. HC-CC]